MSLTAVPLLVVVARRSGCDVVVAVWALACLEPQHDAELGALQQLDLQPRLRDALVRLAEHAVAFEAYEHWLQQTLHCANAHQRAADMLQKHEPAAGTQDAGRFGDCGTVVRDAAEGQGRDDRVEGGVGEGRC